jgi:hypothetical protein
VLSLDLPDGTTNPLVNQLRAAFSADDNHVSCTKMTDFIAMVAKKGEAMTDLQSAHMVSEATRIMGAMGCSPGPTLKASRRAN